MRLADDGVHHLVYCLNIHPGERWADQLAAIESCCAQLRRRLAPGRPFGLGLRISAQAARWLERPGRCIAALRRLTELGMYAVTINGFPYGRFHGGPVKERVYAPDWRSDARLAYTLRLARILAGWLPPDVPGSISTVPGSFGPWVRHRAAIGAIVRRWIAAVHALDELRRTTGRHIALAIEPEPDCWIETATGFVETFDRTVLPLGAPQLARLAGTTLPEAERAIRQHLGICLDTCHLWVNRESPTDALARLRRAGITVAKVQVSAAPGAPNTPAGRRALRRFADDVYLHQTRAGDGPLERARWTDLPRALRELPALPARWTVRTHCHIPLVHAPVAPLRSSSASLDAEFWRAALAATAVFEIETYTFFALPRSVRRHSLTDSIEAEYRWCLRRLRRALRGAT
ncbi:MAG: metabolite traffic protein EboE [Kiritimatiellae bacterium]|nr:metabolite traffic protein EboE [Kiritimatiellia bacterium]